LTVFIGAKKLSSTRAQKINLEPFWARVRWSYSRANIPCLQVRTCLEIRNPCLKVIGTSVL